MNLFRSYNEFFGYGLFEELRRQGLTDVFVAPGSRSTPLVLGAERVGLRTHIHFDERALGFAALGYAKASGRPAAIVTTSGTAVSNLLPAVTEAFHSSVPLILLTADRPFELRGVGANQAIEQTRLFESVVRWSKDLQPEVPASSILTTAADLFLKSSNGPVHLNCAFREPLSPPATGDFPLNSRIQEWLKDTRPFNECRILETEELADGDLQNFKKPLVMISGGLDSRDEQRILDWCRSSQIPVIADVLSQARQSVDVLKHAEWWIPELKELPDLVVWYGHVPQSKTLRQFLGQGNFEVVQLSRSLDRRDDLHIRKTLITGFRIFPKLSATPEWRTQLQRLNSKASAYLHETSGEPSEANCIRRFASTSSGFLMSGSSRPIRDLETYGDVWPKLYCNRGTSGIDGNLATFAGLCLGSNTFGNLVLGDLAFLHDVGSLTLLRNWGIRGRILIVDNNGGGIFHFLPVAEAPVESREATFEKYFGTPHNQDLAQLIRGFGFPVREVQSLKDLEVFPETDSLEFLIYKSDRKQNRDSHQKRRELWKNWLSRA